MSLTITQSTLEKELESAKSDLKDLNENIKRIYGKQEPFGDKKRIGGPGGFEGAQKRNDGKNARFSDVPFTKRRSDAFSRLGARPGTENDEADDFPRPKISSRVISKEQPPASRENALAMQSKKHDFARNKRMFGSLLGTLQKFRNEEDRDVQEKRAKIDNKIEKQQLLVKEQIKAEKDTLIADRRRKQLEIKSLEIKMFKLRHFKAWEEHTQTQLKYIGTKSTPKIYYLPKIMTPTAEALLKESQDEVLRMIEEKREEVNEQIKSIEARLESDLQALQEGKLVKKPNDGGASENSDSDNENENNEAVKEVEQVIVADRKRKRSPSPEKALRSQVVVKRENH